METPETYKADLQDYFNNIKDRFDVTFKECIFYNYSNNIKYVDMVAYPEHFTEEFSVAVWPTLKDRSVDTEVLLSIFNDRIPIGFDDHLNPSNIDYEWRGDIFLQELYNFFSNSWLRNEGENSSMKFYVMTPDAMVSWSVNDRTLVKEELKCTRPI